MGSVSQAGVERSCDGWSCQNWLDDVGEAWHSRAGGADGPHLLLLFSFGYGNIAAGVWALVSAMLAGLVLHLHIVFTLHRLELWYSEYRLAVLRGISLASLCISTAVSIYYAYLATSMHQPVYPIQDSYLIAAVWAFMTVKWSAGLAFFSHKYRARIQGQREYNTF